MQRDPVHDVAIIGSGASGGMAAWNLARKGVNVLMLDAGARFKRAGFWTHVKPWEWRQRLDRGQRPPEFYLDRQEQPYQTPEGRPFDLVRVWGRGGKTLVWGRVSLRYSDLDFAAAERDGWEIPWPIRYKDIAPHYDRVDQLIGVCGGNDDQDSLPGSRYHLPAPAPRCGERLLQSRMGSDPKRSALNGFCQSHEVPNLFVVDGAAFPSATEKNPTLTILALAWRATDYLAEEMRAQRV
ncbi:MAG: NAD(P)-binding protein [Acidobacteria bacterium]|nr:NAD(P)-binding protein [Acidobacteriota bacterium]